MDWMEKLNLAMDYIEENLYDEISYQKLAQITCISSFHFPRMFSTMTGISLSEYIRRRRLSLAAFELQNNCTKVIDIAIKCGYDSADSFTRAFKKQHGITPSKAKKKGIKLKTFSRITFHISILGDKEIVHRIEDLNFDLKIVGKEFKVKTKDVFKEIPKIFKESKGNGLLKKLIDLSWENPKCKLESILGICGETSRIKDDEFEYFLGVRYDNNVNGLKQKIIHKNTWAVFPNVIDAWKRIYTDWLPTSGYELADLPCIECHYASDHEPETELWIPVKNINPGS